MADKSTDQEKRVSSMIDSMFPGFSQKGTLMTNLGDSGDFSALAEMPDSELRELISMEKEFIGG